MEDRRAGSASYQDPLVAIQDGTLVIRRYYFPTGAKRIRLEAISGVEEYAMTKATGRWRIWGSGDLIHWFNLDPDRRHKQQAFIVDVGRRSKPVVTPDDPAAFRAALTAVGIPISTGDPRGAGRRPPRLRAGRRDEALLLSDLALRSKGHWGYDQAFLDACRAELTLAPEEVESQRVTVAERGGQIVGFYALAGDPPEGTLADLFVEPDHIGTGIGRTLWRHAILAARTLGFERITLEADPGAEPFYLAMGARRVGSAPSGSIPGRFIPLLEVPIAGVEEC